MPVYYYNLKKTTGFQKFGNVLWLILGGFIWSIISFFEGVVCFISIIFIPVGFQYFKLAKFIFLPFGKEVETVKPSGLKTFLNILWAIFFGWEHFLVYALAGLAFCVTVIGIPFGLQYFKIAVFLFMPLGRDFKMPNVRP